MKLPLQEVEHEALRDGLSRWDGYVSSALLGVEAIRACGRYGVAYATEARALLLDVVLLPVDDRLLDEAMALRPPLLRSLDAIHLAAALSVRDEIGAFFSYDERLAEAAERHGLPVAAPV